jgi:hypothetical protein
MNTIRTIDSGRKDSLGRAVKISRWQVENPESVEDKIVSKDTVHAFMKYAYSKLSLAHKIAVNKIIFVGTGEVAEAPKHGFTSGMSIDVIKKFLYINGGNFYAS